MRRQPSFVQKVQRRIFQIGQTAKVDTQSLRSKLINELEELFDTATSIAKGKIRQEQVGEELHYISPKERQLWAQVASNIGSVMGNLANSFDETRFNEDFAELEKLVDKVDQNRAEIEKQREEIRSKLTSMRNDVQNSNPATIA